MRRTSDLLQRLEENSNRELERIESMHHAELRRLSESLSNSTTAALSTIKNDTARQIEDVKESLHQLYRLRGLYVALLSAVPLLIICVAIWGIGQYMWSQTQGPHVLKTTADGKNVLVLTDPAWTTCTVEGQKMPCKPVE